MDYLLAKVAMMTSAVALSGGRHKALCLWYFYLWALYKLITPAPTGPEWYWICASGEAAIIGVAVILHPRVAPWIVILSTINLLANTVSIWFPAIYPIYPTIIRTCEIGQCLALILWSQPCIQQLTKVQTRLKEITWMRRLLIRT